MAIWAVLLLGGVMVDRQHKSYLPSPSGVQRDRGDVLLDVFGEFRTILARYLWFKMDLFHETLEVQGKKANEETELLPLLRMVTLLDPTLVEAFDTIAWDLSKYHDKADEALLLLDEGIRYNPESFPLFFRRAMILYGLGRYKEAVEDGKHALLHSSEEFDKLNAGRILYWSANKAADREAMIQALDHLLALRPDDALWREQRAALGP